MGVASGFQRSQVQEYGGRMSIVLSLIILGGSKRQRSWAVGREHGCGVNND